MYLYDVGYQRLLIPVIKMSEALILGNVFLQEYFDAEWSCVTLEKVDTCESKVYHGSESLRPIVFNFPNAHCTQPMLFFGGLQIPSRIIISEQTRSIKSVSSASFSYPTFAKIRSCEWSK
jgi:hypothetical protein